MEEPRRVLERRVWESRQTEEGGDYFRLESKES